MKISELHLAFLKEVGVLLPEWKFVASQRQFKLAVGSVNWLLHLTLINHEQYFDAVGNVAVEFLNSKKRVAVVGAQLGNISGVGQTRHSVYSLTTAADSARSLVLEFNRIGIPFLQRYSDLNITMSVLQAGGQEARLISPIVQNHAQLVSALQNISTPPNGSINSDWLTVR